MLSGLWRITSAPFRLIPWYIWLALLAAGAWFGRNILLIIATILAFHPIPVPPLFQGAPANLAEAQRQDLDHFQHVIRNERSVNAAQREALREAVAGLEARAGDMSAAGFQLELARIQALIDNGHSNASAARMVEGFDRVPVRTSWMAGELRVLRVLPGHEALLGAQLTHINDQPAARVLAGFRDAFGGNDAFYMGYAPLLLEAPDYLAEIGLVDPVYRFETEAGDRVEHRFDVLSARPDDVRVHSSDLAMPWMTPGADWIAYEPQGSPLYLQEPGRGYWFTHLPEQNAVYLSLRENFDDESGESLTDFALRAQAEIAQLSPQTLIIDQRFNGGGDLTRTHALMAALGDYVPADGRIYHLVSGGTFSAGIVNLASAKEAAPARTMLVGEPIGDRLQFWAEGWWYSLPNSGFRARYSTGFYDLQNGCEGIFICPWGSLHIFPILVDDLDIDLPAPFDFASYAAGRDPALEIIGLD